MTSHPARAPQLEAPRRPPGMVVVVMPALNAGRTLARTVDAIPLDWVDKIILVDDKSGDDTLEVARRLPLEVVWHPHNVGYGGNQKTCYLHALQQSADVVVMLHPDGQYEPSLIPKLVEPILSGHADLMLGSRMAEQGMAERGGMPRYKRVANRMLTGVENQLLGTSLSELHTGYRAYSRRLLMTVPFMRNSNDFSFDSELLFQAVHFGLSIKEVPAQSWYTEDASSIPPGQATVYAVKTLTALARLKLHQADVWRSRRFQP